jgi:predicted nucleic acid-binding protein
MFKIYLDNCCYGRPFDDLSQAKINNEAQAVKKVIELSKQGKIMIVSSEFVKYEIYQIPLKEKRDKILNSYHFIEYHVLTEQIGKIAKYYQSFGLKTFDSLHLAAAEINNVDFLLTTDVDFIKFSTRFSHKTGVKNPYHFIKEEINNAT